MPENHSRSSGFLALLDTLLVFMWGVFLLIFPLVFSIHVTNGFIIPKQALLLGMVLLSLIICGFKCLIEGRIVLRKTPFDFPILLFGICVFVSSLLAINKLDAITSFVPFLGIFLSYYLFVGISKKGSVLLFLLSCLVLSAGILSIFSILSFFKIYLIPLSYTHTQSFTPLGSYLEQALYIFFVLPIAGYFSYPLWRGHTNGRSLGFFAAFILILLGFLFTLILLFTTQRPIILPFEAGFQIAFAAISQDAGRIFQGFFFGTGFGLFFVDFTRFKQASFNLNPQLWYYSFVQSSSLILELLSTVGVAGLLSFFFIIFRLYRKSVSSWNNPTGWALFFSIIASFILPFSFVSFALIFFLLAFYASNQAIDKVSGFYDMELQGLSFKRHIIKIDGEEPYLPHNKQSKLLPSIALFVILVFVGFAGFYSVTFLLSDIYFQDSLAAAAANNGGLTYNDEVKAIQTFQYRDVYYRVFSETNLALANSLVSSLPKGQKLSQQQQDTLYKLIQQSIDYARTAAAISPLTVSNWQNMSSVYRSLIGFGQNAEQFTILTNRQAIALDPTNPQEYIALGGVYYQLGQFDNAIQQFQQAVNLKPDFANAYYNLGHAYQQKGDLVNALNQFQAVKQLVRNDQGSLKQISSEIAALQQQIGNQNQNSQPQSSAQQPSPEVTQTPLNVIKPTSIIPTRQPEVQIPGPKIASPSSR